MRFIDVAKGPYNRSNFHDAIRALQEVRTATDEEAEADLAERYLEVLSGERRLPPDEPEEIARYVLTYERWCLYIDFLAKAHAQASQKDS